MDNRNLALKLPLNHPSVQKVIKIAKEVIENNNVLNTQILYTIAKRRLKIPRKGLLSIIQSLINEKILVEGSKYTRGEILNNDFRYKLYRFLSSNLGAHFSMIRKQLLEDNKNNLVSSGQLIWHLEMLLKFNYIKKIKIKNYTVFLPYETNDDIGLLHFILRDDLYYEIIHLILAKNIIKRNEIHKLIKIKRETIYYRLNNLIEFNIIKLIEDDNSIILNPNKKDAIISIIERYSNKKLDYIDREEVKN